MWSRTENKAITILQIFRLLHCFLMRYSFLTYYIGIIVK